MYTTRCKNSVAGENRGLTNILVNMLSSEGERECQPFPAFYNVPPVATEYAAPVQ
jgi:hypothetical protein